MSVKSIIDVNVNDEEFKQFSELFTKYQDQLAKTPGAWKAVGKEANQARQTFEAVTASMLAQNELARRRAANAHQTADATRQTASSWHSLARSSREFAANVAGTTRHILRWAEVGTIFGGLLGLGSLFGLDRLAGSVSAGRRSALGLGVSYGTQQAFAVDYGRVVDPGSFLSGVSEALRDVTKRSSLYGAGLSEAELRGKSTGQVAAELLPHLKAIADRTPTALLGQQLQALGLGQFVSLQEFQRIKATPAGEFAGYGGAFSKDRLILGLSASNQKVWQDFSVQMMRAGSQIENVFVRGLRPLIPALTDLSGSFARAVSTFLSNKHLGEWLTDFGKGLESAATFIGSDKFQKAITSFFNDLVGLGKAIESFLGLFGMKPTDSKGAPPALDFHHGVGGFLSSVKARAEANGLHPINNPGNLRPIGSTTGFRHFRTIDEGVLALAGNLRAYEAKHHLYTTAQIISRYAPANENDTKAYIADVLKRTHHKAGERWDFTDHQQLAQFMAAIIRHEGGKGKLTEPVILKILNETGANVVTSANQVAK